MNTRIISTLVLLVFVISSCQKSQKNSLAGVGDFSIDKAHFVNSFKEYYYRTGQAIPINSNSKKQVLNSELNKYAEVQYAYDIGLAESESAQIQKTAVEHKVRIDQYIKRTYLDTLSVSESEIRETFLKFNTQLRASHLYAPTADSAWAIMKLLNNGHSFDELASKIFATKYLSENAGDLGYFSADDMDIAFEFAAYSMKVGEISQPIKTAQGYSIIKLTDRKIKPLITEAEYLSSKNNFETFALEQKSNLFKRYYVENFGKKVKLNESVIQSFSDKINGNPEAFWSLDAEWVSSLPDETIADYESQEFDVKDILSELRFTSVEQRQAVKNDALLKEFIKGLVFRIYHVEKSKELSEDAQDYIKGSTDETWYSYLRSSLRESVRDTITFTDNELNVFYQKDPRLFDAPLKLRLQRLSARSEEDAKLAFQALNNGSSFNDVLLRFNNNNYDLTTDGDLGWMSIDEFGILAPKLQSVKVGDLVGPIEYQTGEWLVLKVNGRIESTSRSFEEAKDDVAQTMMQMQFKKRMAEIVSQTREKHDAFIDEKKLSNIKISI